MILGYRNKDGRHFPIAKRPKIRSGRSMPNPGLIKKGLLAVLIFCGVLGSVACLMPGLHDRLPISPSRIARGKLVTLLEAERRFYANDYLGTGVHAYWRADIAGLHSLQAGGRSLELIDLPVALADEHPAPEGSKSGQRIPASGYWYRTLAFPGEKTPDADRFAACAFPKSYPASGRLTLIISDRGMVYAKDLGPDGRVDVYPENPIRQGWKIVE